MTISSEVKTTEEDLVIPAVTEDDLRAFHSAHFSTNQREPAPGTICSYEEGQEFGDDDGLGYYEDGVKRTLTDEQIALFRHSEIQTLLREQRHRAESQEYRMSPATEDHPSEESNRQTPNTVSSKEVLSKSKANKRRAKRTKLSTKALHVSEDDPRGRTHRRMARELDLVKEETLELDY